MRIELSERQHTQPAGFEGVGKTSKAPIPPAAKLQGEIRERLNAPNPHQAEHDEAFGPYEQADLALQRFRRERVLDRIAEVTADVDADEIRGGFERLRSALETYRVAIEETQGIILDTPGLDGQALGYDERIVDWYDCVLAALDSLDGEFVKPGLTSLGAYKAAQHV